MFQNIFIRVTFFCLIFWSPIESCQIDEIKIYIYIYIHILFFNYRLRLVYLIYNVCENHTGKINIREYEKWFSKLVI